MPEWIKVEDSLPKHKEIVLVCDEVSGCISLAKFREFDDPSNFDDDDCFDVINIEPLEIDYCVTHWMSLPKFQKL